MVTIIFIFSQVILCVYAVLMTNPSLTSSLIMLIDKFGLTGKNANAAIIGNYAIHVNCLHFYQFLLCVWLACRYGDQHYYMHACVMYF